MHYTVVGLIFGVQKYRALRVLASLICIPTFHYSLFDRILDWAGEGILPKIGMNFEFIEMG